MTTSDEMAYNCHEHFDHPLFWCDEKKRLVERKNAEESIRMWRRRKAEEVARKEKDKQEYYEMFLKHCPWGKPGGGAPNCDVRRKDITAVGLHSTPTIAEKYRISSIQPCRYSDYFSKRKKCHDPLASCHHLHHHLHHMPRLTTHAHGHTLHAHINTEHARPPRAVGGGGGGNNTLAICDVGTSMATQRAAAGQSSKNGELLEITLKDHPSMSFRNKGHVDIEVRYKPTPPCKGKPLLEKIIVTETDKCPIAMGKVSKSPARKCNASTQKSEKPSNKEPWGKAGPGGKPWRSPKEVGSTFMKSLGWTNKEMLKELDQDNPVTPAEKHTFRKVRNTNAKKSPPMSRCCDMCTCQCPAMSQAHGKSPMKKSLSPQQQQSLANASAIYKPQKCSKTDTLKPKGCQPPPRIVRPCTNQTTTETSANVCGPTTSGGGVELVPLLARRRANNRPISLSSTDVTKRTGSNDRLSTALDLHYVHDLDTQVTQKRRSTTMSQQMDREMSDKHFETFDQYWGRPGNGAPSDIKTKLKLDNLLYGNTEHTFTP